MRYVVALLALVLCGAVVAASPGPEGGVAPASEPTTSCAVCAEPVAGAPGAAATPAASSPGQSFTNGLGSRMVWIPPGTFQMGSPADEAGRFGDEGPAHEVRLAQGFWMGSTEVTQGEWEALMGANPAEFKGSRRPVEQVSWKDCQDFCRRLTEREQSRGTLRPGSVYRLPTDVEWEYACRAGTAGAWYGEIDSVAWYGKNSGGLTHDVAQKLANPWGCYDMLGNVWEWCQDGKRSYSAAAPGAPADPNEGKLVLRGGSWNGHVRVCRAAYRSVVAPDARGNALGCRVVLGAPVGAR